jgi:hypothetical protein
MADSLVSQDSGGDAVSSPARDYRAWVLGLLGVAALMAILGFVLALGAPGIARPWTGTAFVLAMGLALVVGASKTSSA